MLSFSEVNSGGSQLKFTVLDYGGITRGSFVGEVVVPLAELRDQTIHEAWLDLYSRTGNRVEGQLNVKLHWIHSKVTFFAMRVSIICFKVKYHMLAAEKWKEAYAREHEELEEYQKHLALLWDPFQGMSHFKTVYENPRGSVKTESGIGNFDKKFFGMVQNITIKLCK